MTTPGDKRIAHVVVAGGGLVGWSAAAALKKRIPRLAVTLVDLPPPPEALADRATATLPSITGFYGDLGLSEADTVVRAGSSFRLGTWFEGWAARRGGYVHAYGPHGQPFGGASFHLHWIRAAAAGATAPFDAYSPAATLARAGRFAHPGPAEPASDGFEYGLFIDPARTRQLLRAFARHVGVEEQAGPVTRVRVRDDGFVGALELEGGRAVEGDLFIDCTGPAAQIRSAIDHAFESWTDWFPCERLLLARGAPPSELPVLDRAFAVPSGWGWQMASPGFSTAGLVYAPAQLSDDQAADLLGASGAGAPDERLTIRPGRRPVPWLRNCIVLGDAAVALEPLEWTNLHLAHSAIDRIVAMMPDRDCATVELAEYNRQVTAEVERVRDFLLVHYVCADRPQDPFWIERREAPLPASLAHTLDLFRERGRLPYFEEETFSRDSWLAVLLGQGVLPRRADPLTEGVAHSSAEATMAQMRAGLATLPSALPSHTAYLHNLHMRARARP